jgi:hypothetical protein
VVEERIEEDGDEKTEAIADAAPREGNVRALVGDGVGHARRQAQDQEDQPGQEQVYRVIVVHDEGGAGERDERRRDRNQHDRRGRPWPALGRKKYDQADCQHDRLGDQKSQPGAERRHHWSVLGFPRSATAAPPRKSSANTPYATR